MNIKPWPTLYVPAFPSALPPLVLSGGAEFHAGNINMYVCGITPYDSTHLGHAATYLTFDLINRYLRATGAEVRYVQNITDIDDPLLERAKRDGIDWEVLAHSQIELFRGDMVNLHILPPESYIGAVEAIPLVTKAIEKLRDANTIYSVDDDLYFQVRSDADFGTRSHYSQAEMQMIFSERGGDPKREGKRDPLDPLLWQSNKPGEPGWGSPMGFGRPGWHIECSVIALSYLLGTNYLANSSLPNPLIDLQGGGSDLIFPHHFMSASLAKALTGNEFAASYVHTGMIGLDREKMSKSKGNLVFVSKLLSQGIDPMLLRYALLNGNYSQDRMWTNAILQESDIFIGRVRSALARNEVAPTSQTVVQMVNAISDNLNTVLAFSHLEAWVDQTEAGIEGGSVGEISRLLDSLLGLAL